MASWILTGTKEEIFRLLRGFHLEHAIVEVLPDDIGSDDKFSSFMNLTDQAVDSLAAQATSGISGRIKAGFPDRRPLKRALVAAEELEHVPRLLRGLHLERAIVEVLSDDLLPGVGIDGKLLEFMRLNDEAVDNLVALATSGISGRIKAALHANRDVSKFASERRGGDMDDFFGGFTFSIGESHSNNRKPCLRMEIENDKAELRQRRADLIKAAIRARRP